MPCDASEREREREREKEWPARKKKLINSLDYKITSGAGLDYKYTCTRGDFFYQTSQVSTISQQLASQVHAIIKRFIGYKMRPGAIRNWLFDLENGVTLYYVITSVNEIGHQVIGAQSSIPHSQ